MLIFEIHLEYIVCLGMDRQRLILPLLFGLIFAISAVSVVFADLVPGSNSEKPAVTQVGYTENTDSSSTESFVPSVSVPEPATFGLISIALAVGGGLLVRRKVD